MSADFILSCHDRSMRYESAIWGFLIRGAFITAIAIRRGWLMPNATVNRTDIYARFTSVF